MKQKLMFATQYLLGLLSRKINGSNVVALVVKTDNGIFAVDPEDRFLGRELRIKGSYGIDEIENLKPFIAHDARVLVVGAHIGTLAIPISSLCKEVVAIEANPNTFRLLSYNIALNAAMNCHGIIFQKA